MNENIQVANPILVAILSMSSINTCQVSACRNSQFTYCPHCSLHICINCLNEHYQLMQNDYKQDLINFRTKLNLNYQQSLDKEKKISEELSQSESVQYDQFKKFLVNKIDSNGQPTMRNFQPCDSLELKQKYTLMIENHQKFDRLLNQINQLIVDFRDNRELPNQIETSSSPAMINEATAVGIETDNIFSLMKSDSVLTIELDNDESFEELSSIDNSNSVTEDHISHSTTASNAAIQTDDTHHDEKPTIKSDSDDMYTTEYLKRLSFSCPLIKYRFGLQRHHCQSNGIANIPCQCSAEKKYLLFSHLHRHHALNASSALKIIRAVIFLPNHLDQIDLFSTETTDSLIGNKLLSYIGSCPLTKKGVYGILPKHHVKLCNKNHGNKSILHHHIRTIHRISHRYATRLVRAVINETDEKTPIIKPDEKILCRK